jgi:hypothetical protein
MSIDGWQMSINGWQMVAWKYCCGANSAALLMPASKQARCLESMATWCMLMQWWGVKAA